MATITIVTTVFQCDCCEDKSEQDGFVKNVYVQVDSKVDAAGDIEPIYGLMDLCFDCMSKLLFRFVNILEKEQAAAIMEKFLGRKMERE